MAGNSGISKLDARKSALETADRIEAQLQDGSEFVMYGNSALTRHAAQDLVQRLRRYYSKEDD